ncbi:MAG: APC family permease [Proteobacteria bacterium]|nr:APC family permease [Pseudomonadota bacterium]
MTLAEPARLRRTLGLPGLVLYGLGTTIGAGVYALMGVIAEHAGTQAPIAFAVASGIAALSAASFAELSARFPRAGGEAVYVLEGLRSERLSQAVGLLVALAGIVSAATVSRAFAGTLVEFVAFPKLWVMAGAVAGVGLVAAWGIRESVLAASLMTILEVGGLLLVVGFASEAWLALPERLPELWPRDLPAWSGVGSAAMLCFFAFLGFEDMVNVAEEVRDVRRTLPVAIALTFLATTTLYLLTATVAVLAVPAAELAASEAPLVLVFERSGGSAALIGWIALLAMLNGALVQIVKSSRVLYGLADLGRLPRRLAYVHPNRRTPLVATGLVVLVTGALAVGLPLEVLAVGTSGITLVTFALANLALVRIHARDPEPVALQTPRWVPVAGFVLTLVLLGVEVFRRLAA